MEQEKARVAHLDCEDCTPMVCNMSYYHPLDTHPIVMVRIVGYKENDELTLNETRGLIRTLQVAVKEAERTEKKEVRV